jgi:hypothetical protein
MIREKGYIKGIQSFILQKIILTTKHVKTIPQEYIEVLIDKQA